jgi:hypothetical protein
MDDRFSEYLIAVGHVCAAAELARFAVEVVTADGQVIAGQVGALRTADGQIEVDQTGLQRTVRIDNAVVNLDEIVRCTMHMPQVAGLPR